MPLKTPQARAFPRASVPEAAQKAKDAHGAVLEAFDKIWLLTIADAGWRSDLPLSFLTVRRWS